MSIAQICVYVVQLSTYRIDLLIASRTDIESDAVLPIQALHVARIQTDSEISG